MLKWVKYEEITCWKELWSDFGNNSMPEINRKIQTDQESIKSKKEENKIKLEPVMNKFLPSLIIFSIPQRNKYNSMQIVIE